MFESMHVLLLGVVIVSVLVPDARCHFSPAIAMFCFHQRRPPMLRSRDGAYPCDYCGAQPRGHPQLIDGETWEWFCSYRCNDRFQLCRFWEYIQYALNLRNQLVTQPVTSVHVLTQWPVGQLICSFAYAGMLESYAVCRYAT